MLALATSLMLLAAPGQVSADPATTPDAPAAPSPVKNEAAEAPRKKEFPSALLAAGLGLGIGVPGIVLSLVAGAAGTVSMLVVLLTFTDWESRRFTLDEDGSSQDELLPRAAWRWGRMAVLGSTFLLALSVLVASIGLAAGLGWVLLPRE